MNRRQFCYLSLGAGAVVSSMAFGQSSSATQQYSWLWRDAAGSLVSLVETANITIRDFDRYDSFPK